MGNRRAVYRVSVGRHDGRHLRRPKRRMKDNIKIDLYKVKWGMEWIYVAYGRDRKPSVENAITKLRVL